MLPSSERKIVAGAMNARPQQIVAHRPIRRPSASLSGLRRSFATTSVTVEELSADSEEDRVDIAAARIPASSSPDSPVGISSTMNRGKISSSRVRPSSAGAVAPYQPHSASPTSRKTPNCTVTITPETMIAFCASTFDRQASRRWTTSWSEPWEAIANTAPPSTETRKVSSPLSGLPDHTRTWVLPASAAAPSQPVPIDETTMMIAISPPTT